MDSGMVWGITGGIEDVYLSWEIAVFINSLELRWWNENHKKNYCSAWIEMRKGRQVVIHDAQTDWLSNGSQAPYIRTSHWTIVASVFSLFLPGWSRNWPVRFTFTDNAPSSSVSQPWNWRPTRGKLRQQSQSLCPLRRLRRTFIHLVTNLLRVNRLKILCCPTPIELFFDITNVVRQVRGAVPSSHDHIR